MDRKELKTRAHQTVKTHWLFLVLFTAVFETARILALPDRYINNLLNVWKNSTLPVFTIADIFKLIVGLVFSIFFLQILTIAVYRLFLEARTYESVPVQHFFYIASVKKWTHTALAWFRKCLYQFLWNLTVIGGAIKYYSYFLVPFILAENPSLSGKEAVNLSRRMMNGHKKEAFVLQLSMLPWDILSCCTLGIAGWLFVFPYKTAVYSEYYAALREKAEEPQLNDIYLFQKAEDETLQKIYKDIRLDQRYVRMNEVKLNSAQKFFANGLGLWLGSAKKRRLYQGTEDIRMQSRMSSDALAKKQYPFRLSPLYERRNAHYEGQLNVSRAYSLWSLILYFILSAFIVWFIRFTGCIDPHRIQDILLLKGPWVFAAGISGLCALMLTASLRKKPGASFIVSALITAAVLYFCPHDQLNAASTVILAAKILYGALLAMVLIYLAAPYIDSLMTISRKTWGSAVIALILLAAFAVDAANASLPAASAMIAGLYM